MPEIRIQFPDGFERVLFRYEGERWLAQVMSNLIDQCGKAPDPEERFQLALIREDGKVGSMVLDPGGVVSEIRWLEQDAFGKCWARAWEVELTTAEPSDEFLLGWVEALGIDRSLIRSVANDQVWLYRGERSSLERLIRRLWDSGNKAETAALVASIKPVKEEDVPEPVKLDFLRNFADLMNQYAQVEHDHSIRILHEFSEESAIELEVAYEDAEQKQPWQVVIAEVGEFRGHQMIEIRLKLQKTVEYGLVNAVPAAVVALILEA